MTGIAVADVTPEAVIAHYADVAEAKYQDSLTTTKALDAAIEAFLASPADETLEAAKSAWLAAR
ncbi:MAG: imelysin family protein, partial [Pseudomonadota bacterium]